MSDMTDKQDWLGDWDQAAFDAKLDAFKNWLLPVNLTVEDIELTKSIIPVNHTLIPRGLLYVEGNVYHASFTNDVMAPFA